jgi:hypothetical protein
MLGGTEANRFELAGREYLEPDMGEVCLAAAELSRRPDEARDDYRIEPFYMTLSQAQIKFENRERRL